MTNSPRPPKPAELLRRLEHSPELRHQEVVPAGLPEHVALLRRWQSDRLARTYADLLTDTRYSAACQFFLNDIYAPVDYSQRDHDLGRIHHAASRVFQPQTIHVLTDIVELNDMTQVLDRRLLQVLVDELGVKDTITPELYARAYRICDNYSQRVRQIELIRTILLKVGTWAHLRVVGPGMKVAKVPAQRAGWGELYAFLVRGYRAGRQLKDLEGFVAAITRARATPARSDVCRRPGGLRGACRFELSIHQPWSQRANARRSASSTSPFGWNS